MVENTGDFRTDEKQIEKWKVKRLIKSLDEAKGNGTSFVSLYIPAKETLTRITQMLAQELAGADNIKSRQTRQSVQAAITSTREKLKLYKNTPENGLCIFCGVIMMEDGKSEKKIMIDIEPFKAINIFTYKCQNTFHTDPLHTLLEDDEKFGFIIMCGDGVLFGTLQGNSREVLQRMSVQLPKKHGRGGQSAMRFARQRVEKRDAYISKCCEMSVQHFITDDKINVKGLILAGCASFKNELNGAEKFDKRLSTKVLGIFDISYGGDNGFSQAITLASDVLNDVKFVQEKKLIQNFYDEMAQDTGMVVFGVDDTLKAMEMSALDRMMLYEDITVNRYEMENPAKGGEKRIKYLNETQEKDQKHFKDPETGVDLEIKSVEPLSDWLLMHYGAYGIKIELITDQSSEGFQFVKGFGGIGGFLRYKIELDDIIGDAAGQYDDFDADEDFI